MKRFILILLGALCANVGWSQSIELRVEVPTDECRLVGTLLLPSIDEAQKVPVALLISGSGPTDRNGNNMRMRNNSLKMIAEELAAVGIASLRYDKRAIGESAYPKFDESQVTLHTYADDVRRWVDYLRRDKRFSAITLIGHSEGAQLALMAAADGARVDKVISIAGAGRPLDVILREQLASQPEQIKRAAYSIIDTLKAGNFSRDVPVFLNSLFRQSVQPMLISYFALNPARLAAQLNVPLLIIQGDADIQIRPSDARALSAANHGADMMIIHQMNHVLKHCTTLDKTEQMSIYSNPSLPLHDDLMPGIVHFIRDGHIHY